MAESYGPRPPVPPPAPESAPLGRWTLTHAVELAGLRREAAAVLGARDATGSLARVREDQLLVLVLSELATNALRYGAQPVTVALGRHGSGWLLDVSDGNLRTPPAHRAVGDGEAGGHGLRILDRATAAWGWYADLDGGAKHVWALLPAAPTDGERR